MYKKVETDKKAVLNNGVEFTPVATLLMNTVVDVKLVLMTIVISYR